MSTLFHILTETAVRDISSKGFNEFVESYKDDKDDLYVLFSNTPRGEFRADTIKPFADAMMAFPVSYVLDNLNKFTSIDSKYITIIKLTGNILDISTITIPEVKHLYTENGVSEEAYQSRFNKLKITSPLRTPSVMALEIIRDKKLLKKYDSIIDTSETISKSILSNDFSSVGYILNRNAYRYITYFNNETKKMTSEQRSIRKLAALISEAIGTRLSNEPAIMVFMEEIFWTVEGMEIHITKLKTNPVSNEDDGTKLRIEIDTPNGQILYISEPSETFDDIVDSIKATYAAMDLVVTDWEPKSRELYLSSVRMNYYDDEEKRKNYISTVNEYYPEMRKLGMKYNVELPYIDVFTPLDLTVMFHIVEKFIAEQDNPLMAVEEVIERNEDIADIIGYSYVGKVDIDMVKKIAMIYTVARKLNPRKASWYVFRN